MNEQRKERYETLLLKAREVANRDVHRIEEEESEPQTVSGGNVARFAAGAEVASDIQEEEADFMQASRLSERVSEIDEALRTLRDDPEAFVTCQRCGSTIEEERLEMVPWSRLCASCAREVEAEEVRA